MWMHKESKWLVRGGRKVRCYLCGKKILKKDPFMFHENTGYYSHNFCIMEANTIDRNERRRAVKKIAVGAAVVGAMAAGAGKFIDISSQSKGSSNSPDTQTILTSQGLILPALTSDPANPVPGQMWYRSDKGVTAHFDSIENRVIYSNRIVNGSAVVTSKGIVNGLSVLPNDGQDWGPDTTLNATAPGQYGGTYTQSTGIQEAVNYVFAKNDGKIFLKNGTYKLTGTTTGYSFQAGILFPSSSSTGPIVPIIMEGESSLLSIYESGNASIPPQLPDQAGGVIIDGSGLSNDLSTYTKAGAVIAADNNNSGGLPYSATEITLKNLYVIGPQGPNIIGISLNFTQSAIVDNVVSGALTDSSGDISSPPNADDLGLSPAALNMPTDTNNGRSVAIDVMLFGYFFGITFSTHFVGDRIFILYCQQAFNRGGSSHAAYIGYLNIENCPLYIVFNAGATYIGMLDIQYVNDSSVWNNYSEIFATGSNNITALLVIGDLHIVESGVGDQPFSTTLQPAIANPEYLVIKHFSTGLTLSTLSANPPVSGTAYQNTNPYDIRLKIPVTYSPTSTAAATLATGTSTSSTVTTSTKVSYPAGITTGIIDTYEMVVKAGQYFEIVVTNATIGTVEVQAA